MHEYLPFVHFFCCVKRNVLGYSKKDSRKEEGRMKYIIRVYKTVFRFFPHAKWQLPLRGVLLFVDVAVRITENVLGNRSFDYLVGVGVLHFWPSFLKKSLTMDYCHVEPAEMQDKMQKGMNALNGDNLGVRGLLQYSFSFICCSVGLLSYGAIITTVDLRILLIIAVMSISSFLFHRHAIRYSDAHTRERDQANRGVHQMTWEARQEKYGKDVRICHLAE